MTNGTTNIQQEIRGHLTRTKEEFNNHLSGKEKKFLFEIALKSPARQEKVRKILNWINEALGDEVLDEGTRGDSLEEYKKLYNNWNEDQKDYDGSLDFGGRLLTLKNLLETKPPGGGLTESEKNIIKQMPGIVFAAGNYLNSSNSLHLERAEKLLAEFNKNDLTIKANPNLNEGVTQELRSNTQRLANSFKRIVESCKKIDEEKNPRS